ncbi:MAG: MBL fold metallo-hydrolase [Dehalococcoidia bacterium]
MEITYLGRTCFRLKGREATVITDPCPPESGYRLGKPTADIVTLSRRDDPAYSWVEGVAGEPLVFDAPGEYEVKNVLVSGIGTRRADGTRNVMFVVEIDGIRIVHAGLPDSVPTGAILEQLNDVDVLLMPVGGGISLGSAAASDLMETIDPHIAIPMHYRTPVERLELDFLDKFLRETGQKLEPVARLQVTRGSIPAELTVQVLEPKV